MLRRYLLLFFAVFLICLPTNPIRTWSQEPQIPDAEQIEVPLPDYGPLGEAGANGALYQPCGNGENDRNSVLCAQWAAADAAKDSADWLFRTFFLSVFTLAAAVTASIFAGIAAYQTKRGAKAAEDSVEEARRNGQAQIRAYLGVDGTDLMWRESGDATNPHQLGDLSVDWKNYGQSPARKVGVFAQMRVVELDSVGQPVPEWDGKGDEINNGTGNTSVGEIFRVGHGEKDNKWLEPEETTKFINGSIAILIFSAVKYTDVFGKTHVAECCTQAVHFAAEGENESKVKFRDYPHHNRDD